MKLRLLQRKDAAGMLEWMHDDEINKNFRFCAKEMTEEKAQKFIEDSHIDAAHKRNIHLEIVCKLADFYNTSTDYLLYRTNAFLPYAKNSKSNCKKKGKTK